MAELDEVVSAQSEAMLTPTRARKLLEGLINRQNAQDQTNAARLARLRETLAEAENGFRRIYAAIKAGAADLSTLRVRRSLRGPSVSAAITSAASSTASKWLTSKSESMVAGRSSRTSSPGTVSPTLEFSVSYTVGGRGGIRTHEAVARLLVFKTSAFDRSATLPAAT
jgi:hypothetical protein